MKYFTVEKIKDYIIKKYPQSCLAIKYNSIPYTDEELLIECEHFFYYEKLKWCGCGCPTLARQTVKDFLAAHETFENKITLLLKNFNVSSVYDNALLLCLAYTIDAAGLTEHGSGIGGAWLTEEGKMYLDILNVFEDLEEFDVQY